MNFKDYVQLAKSLKSANYRFEPEYFGLMNTNIQDKVSN
jgi:hypothetical protein